MITEQILEPFSQLTLFGVYGVKLKQDTFYSIKIKAPEKLKPYIIINQRGQHLSIKDEIHCNWSRRYERIQLELTLEDISYIRMMEPCNIHSRDTLNVDNIEIWARADVGEMDLLFNCTYFHFRTSHTTAGKYRFGGLADSSLLDIHGATNVIANELSTRKVDAKSNSVADMHVCAMKELKATLLGKGNIYYAGNPHKLVAIRLGTGDLIRNQ